MRKGHLRSSTSISLQCPSQRVSIIFLTVSIDISVITCARDRAIDFFSSFFFAIKIYNASYSLIAEPTLREMKNALYLLCEDRDCKWTNILKFVSSINGPINSATGVSPRYIITGRKPNISFPKLPYNELANHSPAAYGMQINTLLTKFY